MDGQQGSSDGYKDLRGNIYLLLHKSLQHFLHSAPQRPLVVTLKPLIFHWSQFIIWLLINKLVFPAIITIAKTTKTLRTKQIWIFYAPMLKITPRLISKFFVHGSVEEIFGFKNIFIILKFSKEIGEKWKIGAWQQWVEWKETGWKSLYETIFQTNLWSRICSCCWQMVCWDWYVRLE